MNAHISLQDRDSVGKPFVEFEMKSDLLMSYSDWKVYNTNTEAFDVAMVILNRAVIQRKANERSTEPDPGQMSGVHSLMSTIRRKLVGK